jgi:hypothetical protein
MKKLTCIISLIFSISCIQTDDFEVPKIELETSNISATTNIKAIKSAFEQSGEKIYTFFEKDDSIVEGYVISSDEAGNFYKTLIIQDNFENPTAGIEIMIDQKALFTKYNFGRKIFIKLAGLTITNEEGKYKLGYLSKNKIDVIPSSLIDNYIIRTSETMDIIPMKIEIDEFSKEKIGTYVHIENIQFKKDEIGRTLAGESFDEFNGERVMEQCSSNWSAILSTSTYSDFRSNLISDKTGTINAVLSKDYYGEKFILLLNDPSGINLTDNNRCDPSYLNCEGNLEDTQNILYYEDFDSMKNTRDLEEMGWYNINLNFGNGKFKKRSKNGNVYMQISAYNSEEDRMEVWLISPKINLDLSTDEVLTFKTRSTFETGTILTVWISNDFDENVQNATWNQLDVAISKGSKGGENTEFISSGKVSLNCLQGDVHIAFKYQGSDPNKTTTYDLDHVLIMSD